MHQCWYLTVQYGEISSTTLGTILVVHITILGLIGSKMRYWELVHQCWVFDSTIRGNFKHNIGYDIGSSHNNIGSYRIKNRILGTSVPVLVFDSTIWGNFKHNIGYDIGSSHNNVGSYRIKNWILGTSVPVLVFDSTIWGNFKYNIGSYRSDVGN